MPFFEFYLHRQGAVWRRSLLWRGLLVVVFSLSGIVACIDDASDRYAYHIARAWGVFGTNQRVTVTASPGLVEGCESSEEILSSCVRAGSPFPIVRISNGDIDASEAALRVSNVDSDIMWDVYLEPLREEEAQDQRCSRQSIGPPQGSSTRFASETGRNLRAYLAPCTALVFVGKPNDDLGEHAYHVAVVGGAAMREGELRLFIQRLSQRTPNIDFVYFLGDVRVRNSQNSLEALDEIMASVDMPWSMVMSPARLGRGYGVLADHVGSLDYYTRIYGMPLIVTDTASASIGGAQRRALQRMRVCDAIACPPAVAMMSIPPVSLHRFEVGIFRSQILAQELLGTLRDIGMTNLVSAVEKNSSRTYFSGVELFDVALSLDETQFLELAFVPRASGTQLCDTWLTIEEGSRATISQPRMECPDAHACRTGICVPTCEQTTDCDAGLQCDNEGFCRAPCGDSDCDGGVCGADDLCEKGPRLLTRQREL